MKGGGFLNNVDGVWEGLEFTHTFPGGDTDPENIYGVLTVRPDGATESVQTTLRFGSSQYLVIAADGRSVSNPEGSAARFWDKSDGYHLLASIEKAGVADGGMDPTDADTISLNGLVGRRMRFEQEKDEDRMAARVKAGKPAKRQDAKTGKEYDFTRLIVAKVYDGPAATVASSAKSAGGSKVAPAKAVKGAAKAAGDAAGSSDGEVTAVLTKVLKDNGGAVLKTDLTRLMTTELLQQKNPRREAVRKRAQDPEYLKSLAPAITFDEVGGVIEVAA